VHAIEDIDNIEIPLRARYIRTLIGELERVHSHLLWLGLAGHFIGFDTLWMWAWKYREPVLEMFEITPVTVIITACCASAAWRGMSIRPSSRIC
jgi:Ni,Fe-hydrogenase III large subunit